MIVNITTEQSHYNVYSIIILLFRRPMLSGQWPGPGMGLKYEIVLRAGPGLDIIVAGRDGPGPQNSICGPGPGQVCTTAAGPGRAANILFPNDIAMAPPTMTYSAPWLLPGCPSTFRCQ